MSKKVMLLGADPELFVARQGKIAHCIGCLGGSKAAPRPVDGGAVQEDNVLFEFNIDPCSKFDDFNLNISKVIDQGMDILGDEYAIAPCSSHIFTNEELSNMPEAAFVFGCDPDYNALTGLMNAMPKDAPAGLRTAGGHIHFGFGDEVEVNESNIRSMMILADYFLGLPSLMLDTDDQRRQLYGKAGAFRAKPYGGEYRTLSNFWVHNDANRRWAWDQAVKAYKHFDNLRDMVALIPPAAIHDAINIGNRKLAEQYIKTLGVC